MPYESENYVTRYARNLLFSGMIFDRNPMGFTSPLNSQIYQVQTEVTPFP